MGLYGYGVRAVDAQGQWSPLSLVATTDVLGEGIGDIDLDGVSSTIADLALFSQYFERGLPAFEVYSELQVAETDTDCDDVPLTVQDLDALTQVVLGTQTPCYSSSPGAFMSRGNTEPAASSGDQPMASLRALSNPVFRVELESISFQEGDSAWVDIVLSQSDAGLLGFQFHLEFDPTALVLETVQRGDALANWQFFDDDLIQTASAADLRIAAAAQYGGQPVQTGDIFLQPAPVTLARLKFGFLEPELAEPVSFAWESCGDNSLVCGRLEAEALLVDSLLLSHAVFSPDGADITAVDARYGGADFTCFYELFGNPPVAAVDFANGSVAYDPSCCVGRVGDANQEGDYPDEVTLGDVMLMVDAKFISGDCGKLLCPAEADINQDGGTDPNCENHVTLGDIMALVDFLFISGTPLQPCL